MFSETAYYVWIICHIVSFAFLCHSLLQPRFKKRVKWRFINLTASDIFLVVLQIIYRIIPFRDFLDQRNMIAFSCLIRVVVMLGFTCLLYKGDFFGTLYICITHVTIMGTSSLLMGPIVSIIFDPLLKIASVNPTPAIMAVLNAIPLINNILQLLVCAIFILCIWQFYKRYPKYSGALQWREGMFLSVPSILGLVVTVVLQAIIISNNRDHYPPVSFFDDVPVTRYLVLLAAVVIVASIYISQELFSYQALYAEERKKQAVMQSRFNDMQQHIQEIEQLNRGVRGLKHDLKNHFTGLAGLLEQEGIHNSLVDEYFESMNIALSALDYEYSTGHPVTDVIINEFAQRMKKDGTQFYTQFQYPAQLDMDVFDISVVLSNALDNAAEAAGRKSGSYVKLWGGIKGNTLFVLEVENSFDGRLDIDSTTGLPHSTKTGGEHGLGLQNIRSCAKKYLGDLSLEATPGKPGIAKLTVMMKGR